jgi:hypothetical protein
MTGQVDGSTPPSFYRDSNAAALFTAPVPEGLGFSLLLFRGRFKKEMDKLPFLSTHMETLHDVERDERVDFEARKERAALFTIAAFFQVPWCSRRKRVSK